MPFISWQIYVVPNNWQRAVVEASKAEREMLWVKDLLNA
jgi:hypothetical protein